MKKLFLSFIAVSALTLFSCEKGSSTAECTAEEASSKEVVSEEVTVEETEEAPVADSTSAE
jgi:hypothetical protein